ncbi:MAG: hypothetical protein LBG22_09245 [Treponema sp.]|jgi:hypothetical protein|nr:hypothetical protein [Treponema sp.]
MKKKFCLSVLCFLFMGVVYAQTSNPFYWDLYIKKNPGDEALDPGRTVFNLNTGESLNILTMPQTDCYCYIIHSGAEQGIVILSDGLVQAEVEKSVTLPRNSGTDTVYIILSLQRQTELEKLIMNYRRNPGSASNFRRVISELQRLQEETNGQGRPGARYSSLPGAVTRGSSPGPSEDGSSPPQGAIRYSGMERYVRIISVRR